MKTLRTNLVLGMLAAVLMSATLGTANAGEREDVERVGADLCKAVRYMDGEPILVSYSRGAGSLSIQMNWFGVLTGLKYTSHITLYFEVGSSRISSVSYSDNGITKPDQAYVEKWRREVNSGRR